MGEHVTSMCERILRESRENFVASLDDVALTVEMRPRIEGWYNDRAFLAEQAKLLWERLDTATEEVKRLRAEKGIIGGETAERTGGQSMTILETCPKCGAEETPEQQQGYVWYACGSYQPGEPGNGVVFHQSDECQQKQMTDARPADHADRQHRVLGITDKILQHAAELRELAEELDGMGCGCGLEADEQPYRHSRPCPMRIAWGARQMARSTYKTPPTPPKDVRHLTPPFRPPAEPTAGWTALEDDAENM